MAEHNLTRRRVTQGALWSVPVLVTAANAPAFAASTLPCLTVGSGGCWPDGCDGSAYSLAVGPYDQTKAQIQTSAAFTFPAGALYLKGTTFTFTYVITKPVGASVADLGMNGEFGTTTNFGGMSIVGPSAWTPTTLTTQPAPGTEQASESGIYKITLKLSSDTEGGELCGGISMLLGLTSSQVAAYTFSQIVMTLPGNGAPSAVCLDGRGQTFTNGNESNELNYGAANSCFTTGAVWH